MSMIRKYTMVSIHYTLRDRDGKQLDSTRAKGSPLQYLHGSGDMLPGLEDELEGKSVGDKLEIRLPPQRAFGLVDPSLKQTVPIELFEGTVLQVGTVLNSGSDNYQIRTVTEINGNQVTLDANHPMAGKILYFDVEVMAVRRATMEEIAQSRETVF
jgi:FKBP-type peptidyl-prolyl cis-trans isomerase SlyD